MSQAEELLLEKAPSRFIVGIDLGTTNCAVAWVDTNKSIPKVEIFRIPQWVDWATVEPRDTLPSFLYQLTDTEQATTIESSAGKWIDDMHAVGMWSRERGGQMPGRQIASAKSWLCHDGVDRTAPILPWHGDSDTEKLSPVQVSSAYLKHIRIAWDSLHPKHPLAEQDVVVTLPASFDEVARELTLEAARAAGLPRIFLIEEPQAAFYAWLERHRSDWQSIVKSGETILVCDIGGGTTDFTLIRVRSANESGAGNGNAQPRTNLLEDGSPVEAPKVTLHRVAVGQHLILGGDNLDLALAKHAERKLVGKGQMPTRQWDALRQNCRTAKEVLLGANPPATYTINVATGGARLIGGSQQIPIAQDDIRQVILDGFFPKVASNSRPTVGQSGFFEFGLPYAADPAITKHLAAFLMDHRWAGRDEAERKSVSEVEAARPDWVLFNGGVLESTQIREAILGAIGSWFEGTSSTTPAGWKPKQLAAPRLDLAVAEGAAYFGLVRRGLGVRIDAKLARSYYLAVSSEPPQAICLVPGDAQAGQRYQLKDRPFELSVGQPAEFPLLVSSIRLADPVGHLLAIDPLQMTPLPPIRTVLQLPGKRKQDRLQVAVEIELTEIGTLQIWCVSLDGTHRWRLEFDVRSTVESDRTAHAGSGEAGGIVDQETMQSALAVLRSVFDDGSLSPDGLMKQLRQAMELDRNEWPPSLLRGLWNALIDLDAGRRKSPAHEARWLNLLGFCLRPGYGMAADDWRVAETWRKVQGKLAFSAASSRAEAIILWRRIAGGFTAGQQLALYQPISARLKEQLGSVGKQGGGSNANEVTELLRLVGSLELLPLAEKIRLGDQLVECVASKKLEVIRPSLLWTIGRLATRVPLYGPLSSVVPPDVVCRWFDGLRKVRSHAKELSLAIMQGARKTGDRYRDVSESGREELLQWLRDLEAPSHYLELVQEGGGLQQAERNQIFGESLPLGLRLL